MAGLVPAIHVFDACSRLEDVDARDKRGHDELNVARVGIFEAMSDKDEATAGEDRRSRR
jgi:hypothetical protein